MDIFKQSRKNMVDGQIHTSGVISPQILHAFENVPRELFVPENLRDVAYTDKTLDLGEGRYLVSPIVHSKMLQAVEPKSGDIVLDIGCASGYSTMILSSMVTTVIAIDNNKAQTDLATRIWKEHSVCNVVLVDGSPVEGVPQHAPYSLIVINGAVKAIPQEILDQLDVGGRLVAVIRKNNRESGVATLFIKDKNGNVSSRALFDACVPILECFTPEPQFVF